MWACLYMGCVCEREGEAGRAELCLCGPTDTCGFKESEAQPGASRGVDPKVRGSFLSTGKEAENLSWN